MLSCGKSRYHPTETHGVSADFRALILGNNSGGTPESELLIDGDDNVTVVGTFWTSTLQVYGTNVSLGAANAGVSNDVFVVSFDRNSNFRWARTIQSTGSDTVATAKVGADGSIVVTGTYAASLNIKDESGTALGTLAVNANDAFLVRFDSSGTLSFAARLSSAGADVLNHYVDSSNGNIIAYGTFAGNAEIRDQNNTLLSSLNSAGGNDAVVISLTSAGSLNFAIRISSTNADTVNLPVSDSSGNVWVSGTYNGSAASIQNGNTPLGSLSTNANDDVYLIKLSSSGSLLAGVRFGSNAADATINIVLDTSGNVYVGGTFNGPSLAIENLATTSLGALTSQGGVSDMFVVKLTSAGALSWGYDLGTAATETQVATGLSMLANNRVVVAGTTTDSLVVSDLSNTPVTSATNPMVGNQATFFVLFNTSGTVQSAYQLASAAGGGSVNASLYIDVNDNIYLYSTFAGSFDIATFPGVVAATLTLSASSDAYLAKFSSNGAFTFAVRAGTANVDIPVAPVATPSGDVIFSVRMNNAAGDLLNGSGSTLATVLNSGGFDAAMFVFTTSGALKSSFRVASTGADTSSCYNYTATYDFVCAGVFSAAPSLKDGSNATLASLTWNAGQDGHYFRGNQSYQIFQGVSGSGTDSVVDHAVDYNHNVVLVGTTTSSSISLFGTTYTMNAAGGLYLFYAF
jgi:hypothetical protein